MGNVENHRSIYDAISSRLGVRTNEFHGNIFELIEWGFDESAIRNAIGDAAKDRGWFKRIDNGEQLAELVISVYEEIQGTDLANNIENLKTWIYD